MLFENCIVLLTTTLDNLYAELGRRTSGYYKVRAAIRSPPDPGQISQTTARSCRGQGTDHSQTSMQVQVALRPRGVCWRGARPCFTRGFTTHACTPCTQEGDAPVFDLYLGVRLAEAASQAMWGSAHYCVQMRPPQVSAHCTCMRVLVLHPRSLSCYSTWQAHRGIAWGRTEWCCVLAPPSPPLSNTHRYTHKHTHAHARTQIKMEHVVELGKMGRDCVATDQLPLSRVCHCITSTLATLASHPDPAELIMTCPGDIALSTLLLLVEVFETEMFERAGHVKAAAAAAIAFLSCHPIGAPGDECMRGPHRNKLMEMGAFSALLRAALTSVMDPECDMIVQQVRACMCGAWRHCLVECKQ